MGSVGNPFEQTMPPQQQIYKVEEKFKPIAYKNVLITGDGNHENRTSKSAGVDISAVIAHNLGLIENYSRQGCVLYIEFKGQVFSVFVKHGRGGGGKAGSKINKLADMKNIVPNADICIHSHTHMPAIFSQGGYFVNDKTKKLEYKETLFVNTNAYLHYGGYGLDAGFAPGSKRHPVIYLGVTKGKKHIKCLM